MATIITDDQQRLVGALLTPEEYEAVSPVFQTPEGRAGILELFKSIISQSQQERKKQELALIAQFAESATAQQRDALLAFIGVRLPSTGRRPPL